jgi:hypothetical protein
MLIFTASLIASRIPDEFHENRGHKGHCLLHDEDVPNSTEKNEKSRNYNPGV